jgi:hypothetical protein
MWRGKVCCGDIEDAELTVMSGRRERQHVSIRARPDRQARTLMGLFCLPPRVEKATPQTQSNRTKRLYSVLPCGVFPYSVCITLAQTPNPRAPARQRRRLRTSDSIKHDDTRAVRGWLCVSKRSRSVTVKHLKTNAIAPHTAMACQ